MNSFDTPAKEYAPGIGEAVADRTVNRKVVQVGLEFVPFHFDKSNKATFDEQIEAFAIAKGGKVVREKWHQVAERVARGNTLLNPGDAHDEFHKMNHHLRQASLLMSGRHLQHGDADQPSRNQEVFTNCSTAASTFLSFYLLLNGSGVGRAYDDLMIAVDWTKQPHVIVTIDSNHKDVVSGEIQDYMPKSMLCLMKSATTFMVPDSREGWAKAVEQMEKMTFEGRHEEILILDFSNVRPRGTPIAGMQNRPASGPGPLMVALRNIALLRGADMAPWEAAMHADHYMAECVLVGGARRAARMATKFWKDKSIFDFITIKRGGKLWSSNNSVTVDAEFWRYVKGDPGARGKETLAAHARAVFEAVCSASYHDGTGEPGFINVDQLEWSQEGLEGFDDGNFAESELYKLDPGTIELHKSLVRRWKDSPYKVITNPCGEIVLGALGGYCVIADVVPFHAKPQPVFMDILGNGMQLPMTNLNAWDADAEDAFRTAARALIRTNLMPALYSKEVKRTNRIGVGITGLHEYAWARFGYGWKDLVDEQKSLPFWQMLARFSNAIVEEGIAYAKKLGVAIPHTMLTMKPAGTTSKLFGLTEGAHLAALLEFLRWVQFRNDDPLIAEYAANGYPTRELKTYSGTTIVGFPTAPTICQLGMGDKLVTAGQATPEEQYQYLRLLEKYWLKGHTDGVEHSYGNQISYTLKYDPKVVSYEEFKRTLLEGQSSIRCCSVMPQIDATAYEYQPEEPISRAQYEALVDRITTGVKEDIGFEHVDCGAGGCPIDFSEDE